jgi:hypothetical protein
MHWGSAGISPRILDRHNLFITLLIHLDPGNWATECLGRDSKPGRKRLRTKPRRLSVIIVWLLGTFGCFVPRFGSLTAQNQLNYGTFQRTSNCTWSFVSNIFYAVFARRASWRHLLCPSAWFILKTGFRLNVVWSGGVVRILKVVDGTERNFIYLHEAQIEVH